MLAWLKENQHECQALQVPALSGPALHLFCTIGASHCLLPASSL